MIPILKMLLCSVLFILLYKAVLENERMFKFNRIYLLTSLIASTIIPFISIPQSAATLVFVNDLVSAQPVYSSVIRQNPSSGISIEYVFWVIYAIGTAYFLFVFLRNLTQLIVTIRNSEKLVYEDYTLVLLDKKVVPHSFLKYIFVPSSETIDNDILYHELSHIKQHHTWDILFIELYKVFFWFNPAMYLYRSAITLNHEFLADEAVLKTTDVTGYQHLLLKNIIITPNSSGITHGFNYSIIKKRLIMMTKKKSQSRMTAKALLVLLLCSGIAFLFVKRVTAQTLPEKTQETNSFVRERTVATEEEMKRYYSLIEKYKNEDGNLNLKGIQDEEKEFLITVSRKMTTDHLFVNGKAYIFSTGKTPKSTISSYDFDKWINDKNYSVFIDTEKVSKKVLKNYKPEDFQHYMLQSDKKGSKYRVDLTTPSYATKRAENAKNNPNVMIVQAIRFDEIKK